MLLLCVCFLLFALIRGYSREFAFRRSLRFAIENLFVVRHLILRCLVNFIVLNEEANTKKIEREKKYKEEEEKNHISKFICFRSCSLLYLTKRYPSINWVCFIYSRCICVCVCGVCIKSSIPIEFHSKQWSKNQSEIA